MLFGLFVGRDSSSGHASCLQYLKISFAGLITRHDLTLTAGRASKSSNITGRVGPGRIGSDQEVFKLSRIGSGHPHPPRPEPTWLARFYLTRYSPEFSCELWGSSSEAVNEAEN